MVQPRTSSIRWSLNDAAKAIGATLESPSALTINSVSTDSRSLQSGALFVALRGVNHDGHLYVPEALAAGAVAAIVESPPERGCGDAPMLVVPDTLKALGDLAAWARRQQLMKVVAITGSNGKTTTKELLAGVLQRHSATSPLLKTRGNLNNLVGLPLTILSMLGDEAVAVLEMGMNQLGEIARLTEIADPDVAVTLNVAEAHLEGVGDIAGVAAAKAELFAGTKPEATIVVNRDDPWVVGMARNFPGRRIDFGHGADLQALDIQDRGLGGVVFQLALDGETASVSLPLLGAHNITNALAAAAAAHACDVPLATIATGLSMAEAVPMRLQVIHLKNGITLVNDSYNANPASVAVAMETLSKLPGRSVAVLGEMRELGDEARSAHRSMGAHAAEIGIDKLFTVGKLGEEIASAAEKAGMLDAAIHLSDSRRDLARAIQAAWLPGDTILVKGSRGAKMDEVVEILQFAGGT